VTEPDLFVVCKSCSSEVSPYVTECPYCGQRVRKRAPRLDRPPPREPRRRRGPARRRRREAGLSRLRPDEIPGIAPETVPRATIALVAVSLLATLALRTQEVFLTDLGAIYFPVESEWWRLIAAPLVHDNLGYQFIALLAVGIFGMHVERRYGWLAVLIVFLGCGAAGAALSDLAGVYPVLGANGAALGLLCAWLVDDRLAARRGDERGNDMLGVYVIAAVLMLLSLAEEDASPIAALGGAGAGTLLALPLRALRR
jgi:membrane associated rhomboid family serine protease